MTETKVPLLPPTPLRSLQDIRPPGALGLGTTGGPEPLTESASPRPAWLHPAAAVARRGGRCAQSRRPPGAGAGSRGSWGAC